jgi:hypothetical protein
VQTPNHAGVASLQAVQERVTKETITRHKEDTKETEKKVMLLSRFLRPRLKRNLRTAASL